MFTNELLCLGARRETPRNSSYYTVLYSTVDAVYQKPADGIWKRPRYRRPSSVHVLPVEGGCRVSLLLSCGTQAGGVVPTPRAPLAFAVPLAPAVDGMSLALGTRLWRDRGAREHGRFHDTPHFSEGALDFRCVSVAQPHLERLEESSPDNRVVSS